MLCLTGLVIAQETEVQFRGAGGFELKGTYSEPVGESKGLPAVLLLPGSGPTDRDGNQRTYGLVTDLLKQIAEHLAKAGFASLRFDKRAAHGYANLWPKTVSEQNDFFSWESFVDDAKAALACLREQTRVDPKRVVIAGHSEGSGIAIQIAFHTAGKAEAPAGLILMGAPGRNLGDVIIEQVANNTKSLGDGAKPYNDYVKRAIDQIKLDGTLPKDAPPAGLGALFPASALKLLRAYFTNEPVKQVLAFKGPVLVIQGEKDAQVSVTRDTPPLEAALRSRIEGTTEVKIVSMASHNLKIVNGDADPGLSGPVASDVLNTLVDWLRRMFRS